MTDRVYDREQLYKEVWAEPMTVVAKRYGISDSALRKHCVKFGVPLPGAGHWARVRAGQKVTIPPLPRTKGPEKIIVQESAAARVGETGGKLSDALRNLPIDQQRLIRNYCLGLSVPSEPSHFHHLLRHSSKRGRSSRGDSQSLEATKVLGLDTNFSEAQKDRAVRILSTLFEAFEHLGYSLANSLPTAGLQRRDEPARRTGIFVCLDKDCVEISLKEITKRIDHEATSEELAKKKRDWFFQIPRYDWIRTNRLHFEIGEYHAKRKNWADSDRSKIEDRIGEAAIWVIDAVHTVKANREEREADELRRWEAELSRLRDAELKQQELQKLDALEQLAQDWTRAQRIRDFADQMESRLSDKNEFNAEVMAWLEWARGKADWLDPLVAEEDDVLGPSPSLLSKTLK